MLNRFIKSAFICALAGLSLSAHAQQDKYPDRTVSVISPFGPGGPNDTSLRFITQALTTRFGGDYVVENRAGAATQIANQYVARAKPDGYTLLYAAAPIANLTAAHVKTSYNLKTDFEFIGPTVVTPLFLVVNADSPVRTVRDFVQYAKSKADGVVFANSGLGASPHLTAELFASTAGFKLLPIPVKGDAASYMELVAGRVDATLTSLTAALPFIKENRLRVIAVSSAERSKLYPDAPTFKESGYPDVVGFGWFGLMAPRGTPEHLVSLTNSRINEIAKDQGFQEKLINSGVEILPQTPEEFKTFVDEEVRKWEKVMTENNIKLD